MNEDYSFISILSFIYGIAFIESTQRYRRRALRLYK